MFGMEVTDSYSQVTQFWLLVIASYCEHSMLIRMH